MRAAVQVGCCAAQPACASPAAADALAGVWGLSKSNLVLPRLHLCRCELHACPVCWRCRCRLQRERQAAGISSELSLSLVSRGPILAGLAPYARRTFLPLLQVRCLLCCRA